MMFVSILSILSFIIFSILYYFNYKKISIIKIIFGFIVFIFTLGVFYYFSYNFQGKDITILNGEVTGKEHVITSCSHSYQCNPRQVCTNTKNGSSCTTQYSTCYEHSNDFDWKINSTVGNIYISRIDPQGLYEPKAWTNAKVGEPFSYESSYFNYIKASPISIFNNGDILEEKPLGFDYPRIFDYYKINRVINSNSEFQGKFSDLNNHLNESLKELGAEKKVNPIVVFHNKESSYRDFVRNKLLGGKINDIFILINTDKEGNIRNVGTFSWSKQDIVNIKLRDNILSLNKLDNMKVLSDVITKTIHENYEHRSISEFKYLEDNIEISNIMVIIIILLTLIFPFAWFYFCINLNKQHFHF